MGGHTIIETRHEQMFPRLTPAEMDYLNSSKMTRDEIFALFRVLQVGVAQEEPIGVFAWFEVVKVLSHSPLPILNSSPRRLLASARRRNQTAHRSLH